MSNCVMHGSVAFLDAADCFVFMGIDEDKRARVHAIALSEVELTRRAAAYASRSATSYRTECPSFT